MRNLLASAFVVALLAAIVGQSRGQCSGQWTILDGLNGTNDSVTAATVWDPDGSGPIPDLLVIGGEFTVAGRAAARGVAAWDGESWRSFGGGLPIQPAQSGVVTSNGLFALVGFGSSLIAAGRFPFPSDTSGFQQIVRWDGSSWSPMGDIAALRSAATTVYALAVREGQLFAAGGVGALTQLGGTSPFVARWTGSAWEIVGESNVGLITQLAVFDGELVAAGEFSTFGGTSASNIAAWDGAAWRALGAGIPRRVWSLVGHAGALIAGEVASLGQTPGPFFSWDGAAWTPFGTGPGSVLSMASVNGSLYSIACASTPGGQCGRPIARWDGIAWQLVGDGVSASTAIGMNVLVGFRGRLFAGGDYVGQGLARIAQWDGAAWSPVSEPLAGVGSGLVLTMARYNGEVVAAGTIRSAGGRPISNIASWNGTRWSDLGGGIRSLPNRVPIVQALCLHDGKLIAAGRFDFAGDIPTHGAAAWDGTRWFPMDAGDSANINALIVYRNELYAGGSLRFARWRGMWEVIPTTFPFTIVRSFAIHQGLLFIATTDYFDFQGLFSWNGALLNLLTNTPDRDPEALAVYSGTLFAAFTTISFSSARNFLYHQRDGTWQPVGGGLIANPLPHAIPDMKVYRSQLVVAGTFTTGGGRTVNNIASWDGVQWRPLGGGVQPSARALLPDGDTLWVGGGFSMVDGRASGPLAQWRACLADVDDGTGAGRCDGGVTNEDLAHYLTLFASGDVRADMDDGSGAGYQDGGVTIDDLLYYLRRFEAGC